MNNLTCRTIEVVYEGDIAYITISPHNMPRDTNWLEQFSTDIRDEKILNSRSAVIDMQHVPWMPQSLSDVIMKFYYEKARGGYRIILIGVSNSVMRYFDISDLDQTFEFAENDSEAANMINSL